MLLAVPVIAGFALRQLNWKLAAVIIAGLSVPIGCAARSIASSLGGTDDS